jgi:hypothetical protein
VPSARTPSSTISDARVHHLNVRQRRIFQSFDRSTRWPAADGVSWAQIGVRDLRSRLQEGVLRLAVSGPDARRRVPFRSRGTGAAAPAGAPARSAAHGSVSGEAAARIAGALNKVRRDLGRNGGHELNCAGAVPITATDLPARSTSIPPGGMELRPKSVRAADLGMTGC